MPPTAEGTGKAADINLARPSVTELEGLINALTGKNIRLAPTNP